MRSDYYNHGFDAMINFDYQEQAAGGEMPGEYGSRLAADGRKAAGL
jgi:hypothetical protein